MAGTESQTRMSGRTFIVVVTDLFSAINLALLDDRPDIAHLKRLVSSLEANRSHIARFDRRAHARRVPMPSAFIVELAASNFSGRNARRRLAWRNAQILRMLTEALATFALAEDKRAIKQKMEASGSSPTKPPDKNKH